VACVCEVDGGVNDTTDWVEGTPSCTRVGAGFAKRGSIVVEEQKDFVDKRSQLPVVSDDDADILVIGCWRDNEVSTWVSGRYSPRPRARSS
jgi:hypothetical protein